jgi:hypothetical protein
MVVGINLHTQIHSKHYILESFINPINKKNNNLDEKEKKKLNNHYHQQGEVSKAKPKSKMKKFQCVMAKVFRSFDKNMKYLSKNS